MSEYLLGIVIGLLERQNELLEEMAVNVRKLSDDVSRCGHGTTGLCMACVQLNDLMRPR